MVVAQYGPFGYWSIRQRQVDDRLALMTFSCPVVGGFTIFSNFQSVFVNHVFPERSIPLHLASWVPSYAMGVKASSEDGAPLPNDSQPVQLSHRSLSRMRVILVVNVDDPRYPLTRPPDVSSNDILVRTSAQIRPLINHQAAPSPYRRPNSFSFSYFACRMADPDTSSFSFSRWLLQAHYVRPAIEQAPQSLTNIMPEIYEIFGEITNAACPVCLAVELQTEKPSMSKVEIQAVLVHSRRRFLPGVPSQFTEAHLP